MLGHLSKVVLCAAACGFPCIAAAQSTVSASGQTAARGEEVAQVRLRYGVAIRNGTEADLGPGLSYSGVSPNDFALAGWVWLLFKDHLGLTAGVQREGFSLLENGTVVTSGGLVRAHVGPSGRIRFGPARLEAAVSYAFQELPVFGTVSVPVFSTVQRHGVLLAARGLVDLGPVTIEGRFEYPLAVANVGRAVKSQGVGVGGGVRVQLFRTGSLKWGVQADAQWQQDSMTTVDSVPLTANQSVVRAGLALDVQWKDAKLDAQVRTAALRLTVRGAQGPLAGVAVTLTDEAGSTRELMTDAEGLTAIADLAPGTLTAVANLAGYDKGESSISLAAGDDSTLEIVLNKEKPKVGNLEIKVISLEGNPLVATVVVNETSDSTDEEGTLSVERLPPGPLPVKVNAPGFKPGEEVASIVAGRTSGLTVKLVPEKKEIPATLRGQVRSARTGKPVMAQLEFRELNQTIKADERGAFSIRIPRGSYTVRIVASGFVTQTKTVAVRAGDEAIFNVDLAPQ